MNSSLLPQHIAIIMDGNGRWAKHHAVPSIAGHQAGVEAALNIVQACVKRGIQVLSLFAFSQENWQRPPDEVHYLMELLFTTLEREVNLAVDNNIRLRFIGSRERFTPLLQTKIAEIERVTAQHTGMFLVIAADYGGRWDIMQALQVLTQQVIAGELTSQDITLNLIDSKLSCAGLPDPDLFIRTSGEQRLSNFMLWQLAYTELYFTPTLWPDFDEAALTTALTYYTSRERRFGGRNHHQTHELTLSEMNHDLSGSLIN